LLLQPPSTGREYRGGYKAMVRPLTVAVTTKDREGHLAVLLTCLLLQTYEHFDIQINNNGEEFETGAVLDLIELHRNKREVKVISTKGLGIATARQKELENLSTKYALRIEDDIVMENDYLMNMMGEKREDATVWFSRVDNNVRVNPQGEPIDKTPPPLLDAVPDYTQDFDLEEQRSFAHFRYSFTCPVEVNYTTGVFFFEVEPYRQMVKYDKFFDDYVFLEDTDVNYGVVFNGGKIYFHPSQLLYHCCCQGGYKRRFEDWVMKGTFAYLRLKVAMAEVEGKYEPLGIVLREEDGKVYFDWEGED